MWIGRLIRPDMLNDVGATASCEAAVAARREGLNGVPLAQRCGEAAAVARVVVPVVGLRA